MSNICLESLCVFVARLRILSGESSYESHGHKVSEFRRRPPRDSVVLRMYNRRKVGYADKAMRRYVLPSRALVLECHYGGACLAPVHSLILPAIACGQFPSHPCEGLWHPRNPRQARCTSLHSLAHGTRPRDTSGRDTPRTLRSRPCTIGFAQSLAALKTLRSRLCTISRCAQDASQ